MDRFGQMQVDRAGPGGFCAGLLIPAHLDIEVDQVNHTVKLLQLGLDTDDAIQSEFSILIFDSKISRSR